MNELTQQELSHVDTLVSYFPYELKIAETHENGIIHRMGFVVMSDIDGTANRQHDPDGSVVPEAQRIQTVVGSSDEAFNHFETNGIPVWLISSRTLPEVQAYQQVLDIHGGAIVEDGTAILLPDGLDGLELTKVYPGYHLKDVAGKKILVLAPEHGMDTLERVFEEVRGETNEELVTSIVHNRNEVERLMTLSGHATFADAEASIVRFASSYIPQPTEEQRRLIHKKAQERGDIRVFDDGHVIHVMAGQANKATALSIIYDHPSLFFPKTYIDRIFPIACGNHINDIQLIQQAVHHGGIGVLVAGPTEGTYYVDTTLLPEKTVLSTKVAGEGLKEVAKNVISSINQQF